MKKFEKPCITCRRAEAIHDNGRCEKCNSLEKPCSRCGRREAYKEIQLNDLGQEDLVQFGRCEPCLKYAADYQRKRTEQARKESKCIVCRAPSELSRCERCAAIKRTSVRKNKVA